MHDIVELEMLLVNFVVFAQLSVLLTLSWYYQFYFN